MQPTTTNRQSVHWMVGSDHAGFGLKSSLVQQLQSWGDTCTDLGTHDTNSVDYPHYGAAVARAVVSASNIEGNAGRVTLGLVVCGSGIGISIAANKIRGARCALVHDSFTAAASREHNDANIVAMGARVIGEGVAIAALQAFRNATFLGDRHTRRVAALNDL
jgi:ribose 5-phosphate isomerase B